MTAEAPKRPLVICAWPHCIKPEHDPATVSHTICPHCFEIEIGRKPQESETRAALAE